jgi:hypothetical protein
MSFKWVSHNAIVITLSNTFEVLILQLANCVTVDWKYFDKISYIIFSIIDNIDNNYILKIRVDRIAVGIIEDHQQH